MELYVVYSKSKIHGVYDKEILATDVLEFLQQKAGHNIHGIPKKFYYMEPLEMNKLPKDM
jgi:hypothetical protein